MHPRVIVHDAATRLAGPLLFLRRTLEVGLNESVEVRGADSRPRLGRVAAIDEEHLTVELLESSAGLALAETSVRFLGAPIAFGLGPGLLGRIFNGIGEPIDGGPPVAVDRTVGIEALTLNPVAREERQIIETGITAIDLMNSLVRGQKLPLFSGGGLPHDRMAVEIASNARLRGAAGSEFAIVFAAIGVPFDSAEYFRRSLERSGALERAALFLDLRERLLRPAPARAALRAHRRPSTSPSSSASTCWWSSPTCTTIQGAARGGCRRRGAGTQGCPGVARSRHALRRAAACTARRARSRAPILTMPVGRHRASGARPYSYVTKVRSSSRASWTTPPCSQ